MAKYRKLGRKTDVRLALLRSQATALIANGKIVTTEARAKEVRKMVEPLIALAVKEKDNFETVSVTAKVPRKDANGKRVREEKDGKRVVVYDTVQKEIKKKIMYRLIIFASRKTCEYIGFEFPEIVKLPESSEQYVLGEREKCIYRINFK